MRLADKFFSLFQRDVVLYFSTLLTGVVIARTLGPEMMGVWTILLLIPGYAEAFGRLQFYVSAVYFLGKRKAGVGEMAFLLHLISLLVAAVILSVFYLQFEWLYASLFDKTSVDVRGLAYTVIAIFPLRLLYYNYSYLLIAKEDVKSYNGVVILQALIGSIGGIFLILALDMGILGAIVGNLTGLVVAIIYAAYKVHKIEAMRIMLRLDLMCEMSKYALKHYAGGVTGYFHLNVTSLLSASYMLPAQIAFYALGKSISEVATRMVPVAVNTILFPRVSQSNDAKASGMLVARLFRVTFIILLAMSLGLAIFIKPVIYLLYGASYYPLIVPFLIMIPSVVLVQAATVFLSYFSGQGRPDLIVKVSVAPLVIQCAAAVMLVPKWMELGAAMSFSLAAFLLFLLQLRGFLKLSGLPALELLPQMDDVATILKFGREKLASIGLKKIG